MKLVFFGGVHGVGKTTLLERVVKESPAGLHVVDPGELFWEHVYHKKDKTPAEVEMLVIELIAEACRVHPVVICNWHYAVWTPGGYVPQLAFDRLALLIDRVNPECAYSVLVGASARIVLARRVSDRLVKKRKIDLASVEEEIAHTERLYRLHGGVVASRVPTVPIVFDNEHSIEGGAIRALVKTIYETS